MGLLLSCMADDVRNQLFIAIITDQRMNSVPAHASQIPKCSVYCKEAHFGTIQTVTCSALYECHRVSHFQKVIVVCSSRMSVQFRVCVK